MTDTQIKCSYMKLATSNYYEINSSNINYCIYCYGITQDIKESKINNSDIYWISDKGGLTGGCKKCFVDAIIPGNYFNNTSENDICEKLNNWYKEGFT